MTWSMPAIVAVFGFRIFLGLVSSRCVRVVALANFHSLFRLPGGRGLQAQRQALWFVLIANIHAGFRLSPFA